MVSFFPLMVKPLVRNLLEASISAGDNVPAEVLRAVIQLQFGSVTALARAENVSHNLLYAALSRPQATGNHLIAERLGVTVHQLWPLWFTRTGRRRRSGEIDPKTPRTQGLSQKAVAA